MIILSRDGGGNQRERQIDNVHVNGPVNGISNIHHQSLGIELTNKQKRHRRRGQEAAAPKRNQFPWMEWILSNSDDGEWIPFGHDILRFHVLFPLLPSLPKYTFLDVLFSFWSGSCSEYSVTVTD